MSLINDALKEAQRERSGRGGIRGPGPFVENIFPYPDAEKTKPSAIVIAGIAAAGLIVLLGGGLIVRGRMHGTATKPSAPFTKPAPVVQPQPSAPAFPVLPAPSGSVQPNAPAVSAPKSPPIPPAQANLSRPTTLKPQPVATTAAAPKPAAPKVAIPTPSTPTTRADSSVAQSGIPLASGNKSSPLEAPVAHIDESGVRLVIDPAGNGPADSLFRLAYTEQMKNNLDGAQALYEKAIATRHAPAEAYNDYGVLLLSRGNRSAATEMFRQALNHDDKNVEAWVNLGDSFNGMGYHAEAMSAYARANQLDPSRPAVQARVSREYEAIGDTASARRHLEEAVKSNPNDASAHYALGSYLQRARDLRGAIREFQSFVDLSSAQDNQEFVGEMRRHIIALKQVAP